MSSALKEQYPEQVTGTDMKMQKEKLYGKNINELIAVTKRIGLPGFAARQIADWLYKKEISSIEEMTNLSKRPGNFFRLIMKLVFIHLKKFLKALTELKNISIKY